MVIKPIDGNISISALKRMKAELLDEKTRELMIKKHYVYDAAIETLAHVIRDLEMQPALDVVQVVRCKDCIHAVPVPTSIRP